MQLPTEGGRSAHGARYIKQLIIHTSCLEEFEWPKVGGYEVAIGEVSCVPKGASFLNTMRVVVLPEALYDPDRWIDEIQVLNEGIFHLIHF